MVTRKRVSLIKSTVGGALAFLLATVFVLIPFFVIDMLPPNPWIRSAVFLAFLGGGIGLLWGVAVNRLSNRND